MIGEPVVFEGLECETAIDGLKVLCRTRQQFRRVVIRSDICEIKDGCFGGDESVQEVIFESDSKLRIIGKNAFETSNVTTITIPSSVEVIGDDCFFGCRSLSEVIFEPGSRLRRIGASAFGGTKISQIVIPASVEVIGEFCFSDCQSLCNTEFEAKSELKELQEQVVESANLARFEIPAKCEILTGQSLVGIKSVSVSRENPFFVIEDELVLSSDKKRAIRYLGSESRVLTKKEIEVIGDCCFIWNEFVNEIVFEEDSELRKIEGFAFRETKVTKIEIPSKCEVLDGSSFWNNMKTVTISRSNRFLKIAESFVMSRDGKRLIRYLGSEAKVRIRKEIEVIVDGCFATCEFVREVEFEEGSRLQRIGKCAFRETGLRRLSIPSSVEVLGLECFANCQSLYAVSFENKSKLRRIGRSAFIRTGLTSVGIPSRVEVIKRYAFANSGHLHEVTFETGSKLRRLGDHAFSETGIKKMIIPSSVEMIEGSCFSLCRSLRSITLEGSKTVIAETAFTASSLEEISVPFGMQLVPSFTERFRVEYRDE
jgi:hypothetical protein